MHIDVNWYKVPSQEGSGGGHNLGWEAPCLPCTSTLLSAKGPDKSVQVQLFLLVLCVAILELAYECDTYNI